VMPARGELLSVARSALPRGRASSTRERCFARGGLVKIWGRGRLLTLTAHCEDRRCRASPRRSLWSSANGARVIPSRGCTLCKTCPPPAPLNRSSRFAAGTVTASCSTTRCSWCSSSRLHQHQGFYWIPPRPRTLYHLIGLLRRASRCAHHAAFRRACDTLRGCAHRRDKSTSCRPCWTRCARPGEPSHYDYLAWGNKVNQAHQSDEARTLREALDGFDRPRAHHLDNAPSVSPVNLLPSSRPCGEHRCGTGPGYRETRWTARVVT